MGLRPFAPLLAAALLAGCSSELVVVMPPSGEDKIGGVVVHASGAKDVVLDQAYASDAPGDSKAGLSSAQDVNKGFGEVLGALPIPPQPYRLPFEHDSFELTPEILKQFDAVVEDIGKRKAAEIVIIGHTDPSGTHDYNIDLSRKRAETVKGLFLTPERQAKLPVNMTITTGGRGEQDAEVPAGIDCAKTTEDPKCQAARYVEITVQ
jgi:OmpA-OmpF porin, OOP family